MSLTNPDNRHLSEEDLILLYYAETDAPGYAGKHLAECPECRAAADSLARTMAVCNEWKAPDPAPDFGRDIWMNLVTRMDSPRIPAGTGWRGFFLGRSVRIAAAAVGFAIILFAVFFAGRYSRPAQKPVMTGLSDRARDRILAIAVADHLDRVQILLTEIADSGNPTPQMLAADRENADDLVQEGRLMRQSLAADGETVTTTFLDEIERFLIEAAHTPESASPRQINDLRDRIRSASLLFKVRIVESNLRSEEQKL